MATAEQRARESIDRLLAAAGWLIQDFKQADIHAARGVALREFLLNEGFGKADYLLYVDGKAAGVIEAKKQGATLTGVEVQSGKYAQGLPATLPAWRHPLPFIYESTGAETHFTNALDPEPRARNIFAFHKPGTLAEWLLELPQATVLTTGGGAPANEATFAPATFLARVRSMPELVTEWGEHKLWPAQIVAIQNLEKSLAQGRPRALIQMATGSGKTFTAISFIYRLIKYAGARRVLFLVDRGNLGRQTKKEFDQYVSPVNNFKFGEEYIVQHLANNNLDKTARVVISTIQRMFSMLKGRELPEDLEEASGSALDSLVSAQEPIDYNPAIPIETFDIIVTDEAHRSIYNLWRQVLEYFDASLIGLTATPSKQTFGFFNQNLVMEYGHEQAVADGVNVNYDVYRIRTQVSEAGGMSLIALRKTNSEIVSKHIQQLVKIAGEGVLKDGSTASQELREFLADVPTEVLGRYLNQCLETSFEDSGLVLQDVVNELGERLGCSVERGLYRGKQHLIGFDGIWRFPDGYSVVVEVKTTDAYAVSLDKLAGYRKALIVTGKINDRSSILIVVGRKDTDSLEAQVRGSRHGWDIRLISADKLLRLVEIKEAADNKETIQKIRTVLTPLELTKVDFIVELLATTAEDIKQSPEDELDSEAETSNAKPEKKFTPVAFHAEVVERVAQALGISLKKETRSLYATSDKAVSVRTLVSKAHVHSGVSQGYWYAFHPYYRDALDEYGRSYVAFGCGGPQKVLMFDLGDFVKLLPKMNTTEKDDRAYWHVHFVENAQARVELRLKGGEPPLDVTSKVI